MIWGKRRYYNQIFSMLVLAVGPERVWQGRTGAIYAITEKGKRLIFAVKTLDKMWRKEKAEWGPMRRLARELGRGARRVLENTKGQ